MKTVALVHHRVADFDAWKEVYDGFRGVQRERGVRHHHVWRSREESNAVVIVHTFDSLEAAEAFFGSEDLRGAMGRAGVDPASIRLEYLEEVEGGAV